MRSNPAVETHLGRAACRLCRRHRTHSLRVDRCDGAFMAQSDSIFLALEAAFAVPCHHCSPCQPASYQRVCACHLSIRRQTFITPYLQRRKGQRRQRVPCALWSARQEVTLWLGWAAQQEERGVSGGAPIKMKRNDSALPDDAINSQHSCSQCTGAHASSLSPALPAGSQTAHRCRRRAPAAGAPAAPAAMHPPQHPAREKVGRQFVFFVTGIVQRHF